MRAPNGSDDDFQIEAFRDALAHVIADQQKQWKRERQLIQAQAATAIAECRNAFLELQAELKDVVEVRLANLHNGAPGRDGPRGERGECGPPGPPGGIGERGECGATGRDGVPGPQGPAGERGTIGPQGIIGAQGEPGAPGPRGDPGASGERGPAGDTTAIEAELREMVTAQLADVHDGAPGPAGERGADGAPGPAGEMGPPGVAGASGSRGEAGPQGEQGPPGEIGPAGAQGEPGAPGGPGEAGAIGPAGERGADGVNGRDGAEGPAGPAGAPGERGEAGAIGAPGERGERGDQGEPGRLPIVKAYKPGAVHYAADVVAHAGGMYQAKGDTATAPPSDDWTCLAAAGVNGKDGSTPNICGTFNPEEIYARLDIVALSGSSFIAIKHNPGPCPGDGWQLIASAGRQGKPGIPGAKGEPGAQGDPGAVIVAWRVDRKTYSVQPVMSDGSEVLPINMRDLFEQYTDETR